MALRRIDHVQLAMPAGGEDEAIRFYEGVLGVSQVPKPPHLAGRGGCWFEQGDLKIHLGVDGHFRPARKAHPALLVDDLAGLITALAAAGLDVTDDEPLEGYDRVYVNDPFGNRIELLEPTPTITFRPLTLDDLELLVEWFADPVVAAWWNQPAEIESVRSKYLPGIDGTGDPTLTWIAEIGAASAGLFQSYLHTDHSEHDIAVGLSDAAGIDYLLGASHRGRRLGRAALRAFAGFVLDTYPEAAVCVATPAAANTASCTALERAGFERSHDCRPPGEPPSVAYTLSRAESAP